MREWGEDVRLPGRLMLAAGFVGFGVIGLSFDHLIDGLQPIEAIAPWTWASAIVWLLAGGLTAAPAPARRFGHWLALGPWPGRRWSPRACSPRPTTSRCGSR